MIPLDYDLLCQRVTVYRMQDGRVKRRMLEDVYYEHHVYQKVEQGVCRQVTRSLLIALGEIDIRPGDRVYDGVGPDINEKEWRHFLPVTIHGLSEIEYVRPYYWGGQVCHTEAGRR